MKLFQQMLVATASLGLIAPIAAQASDVINLKGMNDYNRSKKSSSTRFDSKTFVNEVNEDIAILKGRVDGLEAQQNNFEAGSFSDTTTLDGKAVFSLGMADTDDDALTGKIQGNYTYQMNLNSSFTGDDNLYVRIKSGNHSGYSTTKGEYNTYLSAGNGNADVLKVDKIWYSTPVGENNTVFIGPKVENYYMHATTPSIYKPVLKAFALGGNAAAYGASTSPGAGWKYVADNGFAVSSNFTTKSGNTSSGMLTDEGATSWATQVGYTKPRYSVSAIINQKYNGWQDTSYFTSDDGALRPGDGSSTNIGLRGWWRPENTGTATPSISVGYDTSETDATGNSNTTAYFVGLNWQDMISVDDRIGIAFGQPQKHEDDTVDPFLYEAYYDYKVNDSITVTPTIFGGTAKNASDVKVDMSGYVVNTTFKF
jgi:hypothetical protein